MKRLAGFIFVLPFIFFQSERNLLAFSGAEGASFLEIPVGARPAALGSAYTALANDAYAPVWNPAGLGFLDSTQVAGMHQIYIDETAFDYVSVVHPFRPGSALGISAQYFNPGRLDATDASGNAMGTFSGYYGAYSLSYGQRLTDTFSLGLTGKLINGKIADVSASAYAADAGVFYRPTAKWTLAAVAANLGSKLKFISQSDTLPQAYRVGGAYALKKNIVFSAEGVAQKDGPTSAHAGGEWTVWSDEDDVGCSIRGGYSTDRTRELSALAGLSVGAGAFFWGQELSYAFMPLGDFGQSHYISLVLRFGVSKTKKDVIFDESTSQNYDLINEIDEDKSQKRSASDLMKEESPSRLEKSKLLEDQGKFSPADKEMLKKPTYSKEMYE